MDKRYIIAKILRYSIITLLILTVNFAIPRMMPGDPISNILGDDVAWVDQATVDDLTAQYGLDKSVLDQYLIYLSSIFTQDLGYSISMGAPVSKLILSRASISACLMLPAIIIGSVSALYLATFVGMRKGGRTDKAVTSFMVTVHAMPAFLSSMLMLTVFSYHLDIFPLGHFYSGDDGTPFVLDVMYHLALPIIVLSCMVAASYYLVLRNSVVQIKDEYFITAERAHGIPERVIKSKHVRRNVLTQWVSMFAMSVGGIISGSLILEIVFSIEGMGSLLYDAIMSNDYPLMQGCFIVICFVVLAANMAAEILYGLIDPRVADGGGR
ncbi:MAG: ABC transporter permease [Methanomassiliicoccales archaeon]|nr:ABC transporter permease [Methanomassiliicoccales archaeon]